jgi:hypothetical protein
MFFPFLFVPFPPSCNWQLAHVKVTVKSKASFPPLDAISLSVARGNLTEPLPMLGDGHNLVRDGDHERPQGLAEETHNRSHLV